MNYEIGSRIGDYEIIDILGAGGMGQVYKVRNTISDRVEAMKVLLPDLEGNSDLAERFVREIKVQASLDHPNIAALHTALRMNNQLLMLMEYVEGSTLADTMKSGPLAISKAVDIVTQVLSALACAHSRAVIHRDIKPANIMITRGGQTKLMDFGIAKMALDSQITQTGSTVGSLYYMSPEQIKDTSKVDGRSDLYSLGVTLYEAVTNVRPFEGDSGYSIMVAHLEGIPKPPVDISPDLPVGLSDIILKALEKDPAGRFQTADEFRSALQDIDISEKDVSTSATTLAFSPSESGDAVKDTSPSPASRPARSRRKWGIAAGLLLVLLVGIASAIQIGKFRRSVAGDESARAPIAAPADDAQTPETAAPPDSADSQKLPESAEEENSASIPKAPEDNISSPAPQKSVASGTVESANIPGENPPVKTAVQPPPTSTEDPRMLELLNDIRQQYNFLSNVRLAPIREAIDNLDPRRVGRAPKLRTEAYNSYKLMNNHLAETGAALNRGDAPGARRNLEFAKREIEKLERMLRLANLINRRPAPKQKTR